MSNDPFSPTSLGSLELKNRFVRSATWDGMGFNDGSFSPAQIDLYKIHHFDNRARAVLSLPAKEGMPEPA